MEPGDREGLAQAMTRLYEMSQAEREEMGRRGRERVVSQFSAESMIRQYEKLFADAFACWHGRRDG